MNAHVGPIDHKNVTETFVRGSGKGGQNRNKVETGVVLVHRPTGITVRCVEQRTQGQNRKLAWARLQQRVCDHLATIERQKVAAAEAERRRRYRKTAGDVMGAKRRSRDKALRRSVNEE